MQSIEWIFSRRSIRHFKPEVIDDKILTLLVKCAMYAPSAGNQRPWCYLVITDRALLDQIPLVHPYAAMLKEASAAILVCGDPERQKHSGYWVQDCSAATQNILLGAHSLGLGSVWLGVHPRTEREEALRKLFSIPEPIIPFSLVALGYPATSPENPDRYEGDRIRHNQWKSLWQLAPD
ncbi:MAG TPA: nitroreductase family protein [Thermoanaerobaculia bacterium]|nr:nitroreductase family protein [Thermoanaerobaculia bacterium]HUM28850.1 nitroreductase family protein [Thermoanaerobaculia bacterium]HXK67216.1 nitroreductase family protein [Thermoanaerobaculia bacterium]